MEEAASTLKTEFIKELHESAQFNTNTALKKYNLQDITELTFLYFLAIQILKHEFDWAPFMSKYARRTMIHGDFAHLYYSGSDLSILIHIITGQYNSLAQNLLKDKEQNEFFRKKIDLDLQLVKRYLVNVRDGKEAEAFDRRFLLKIEQELNIQDAAYKSVRRLVQDWPKLNDDRKKLSMTRLLLAIRARVPKSELRPYLENVSKKQHLELKDVCNPETGENCEVKTPRSILGKMAKFGLGVAAGYTAASLLTKDKD